MESGYGGHTKGYEDDSLLNDSSFLEDDEKKENEENNFLAKEDALNKNGFPKSLDSFLVFGGRYLKHLKGYLKIIESYLGNAYRENHLKKAESYLKKVKEHLGFLENYFEDLESDYRLLFRRLSTATVDESEFVGYLQAYFVRSYLHIDNKPASRHYFPLFAIREFLALLRLIPPESFKKCEDPTCERWFILNTTHRRRYCDRNCASRHEQAKLDPKEKHAYRRDYFKEKSATCYIIGYTRGEKGTESFFKSLALADLEGGEWTYRGSVRSGIEDEVRKIISLRLKQLKADSPPESLSLKPKGWQWVIPELKCEINFAAIEKKHYATRVEARYKTTVFRRLLDFGNQKAKAEAQM